MLSVVFYLWLCWVSISWVSLCWVSLWWVSLCLVPLRWVFSFPCSLFPCSLPYQASPSFSFPSSLPTAKRWVLLVPYWTSPFSWVFFGPYQTFPTLVYVFLGSCKVFSVSWSLLFLPFQSGVLGPYKASPISQCSSFPTKDPLYSFFSWSLPSILRFLVLIVPPFSVRSPWSLQSLTNSQCSSFLTKDPLYSVPAKPLMLLGPYFGCNSFRSKSSNKKDDT